MSRSQHIIAAGVKQEHHPLMSSETRIFFLGLDFFLRIPAFFSRIPRSAAPRISDAQTQSSRQFWDAQERTRTCARGLLRSRILFVWRFGDVCEVFRRREEEDPVSAAAGGWCAGQSAVSADAAGQWTRPAGESEETILPFHPSTPLSFFLSLLRLLSRVSVLAEQEWWRPGLVVTLYRTAPHRTVAYTGACCHAAWKVLTKRPVAQML